MGGIASVLSSWQTSSSPGLRTFEESVKRQVRNVPLPCPVCILDWLRLFLHLKDAIHLFQSYLLVLTVFSPSLVLDKHACDKPE